MKTNKKGISLIVLVITIIVMIILAAVVILYLEDDKIIEKTKIAVTSNNASVAKEVVTVARAEWRTNKEKILEDGFSTFEKYAENKLEKAGFEIGFDEGQVEVSENGLLYVYIKPIIPEGYIVSDLPTENKVSKGLVIYEGTEQVSTDEDAQTTRNQFVWVPVPDMSEFVRRDWYETSLSFLHIFNGDATEPYSYDTLLTETNDLTGEYAEYAKMRASVAKYGGFYIARYEAGTTNQRTDISNGTSFKVDGITPDILSQKDKYPYYYVAWGSSMTSATGDVTYNSKNQGKGAVELSRSIYPEDSDRDVVSTLCYGVQWDAVMKFMENVENPYVEGKKYIEDSTGMGWYSNNYSSGNPNRLTGIDVDTNKSNMVKNIYDMAGNVWEWTMEAYKSTHRFCRGGRFLDNGSSGTASKRNYFEPNRRVDCGFRVALYIK